MRFLVDANLPPGLAGWLASLGHDAQHARDLGLDDAPDHVIWQRALETDAVIVTKDEDFALLRTVSAEGPAVVWIRIGNALRRVLFDRLTSIWPDVVAKLQQGERLIEIR